MKPRLWQIIGVAAVFLAAASRPLSAAEQRLDVAVATVGNQVVWLSTVRLYHLLEGAAAVNLAKQWLETIDPGYPQALQKALAIELASAHLEKLPETERPLAKEDPWQQFQRRFAGKSFEQLLQRLGSDATTIEPRVRRYAEAQALLATFADKDKLQTWLDEQKKRVAVRLLESDTSSGR